MLLCPYEGQKRALVPVKEMVRPPVQHCGSDLLPRAEHVTDSQTQLRAAATSFQALGNHNIEGGSRHQ